MLYIVPTPVGNLQDMTFRAIETLKSVDLILAEDTRTSGVLLQHFDIHTPLKSHHKFNEHETSADIVERLKAGANIALISDAGTPAISDPGFFLPSVIRDSSWYAPQPKRILRSSACLVPRLSCRLWWIQVYPTTISISKGSCRRRKVVRPVCSTWRNSIRRSLFMSLRSGWSKPWNS